VKRRGRLDQPSGSEKGSFIMRSKMLGLAIALSTFGLGVAATTLWIAHHTSHAPQEIVTSRRVVVPADPGNVDGAPPFPLYFSCEANNSPTNPPAGARAKAITISGGVLNGKAISKPAPDYPAIARAAQASGTVVVMVKVDECGNVVSAKGVSGHPLLQQAAMQAAYGWRFSPTLLSGQPVKVSGTITFNFLLQ
jgi:TonB family protein